MLKNVLKVLRGPFGPVLVLDGPDLYKKNRTGPKRTGGPSVHYLADDLMPLFSWGPGLM